jgi:ComF family protein
LQDLPNNTPACSRCAISLPQPGICGPCLRRPPPFSAAVAALHWQSPVDFLLHRFKYQRRLELGVVLGEYLAEQLLSQQATMPELLLPTPLHPQRLRSRGFNQALEISHIVAARLALTVTTGLLLRSRPTLSQTGLAPRDRRRNIRGAFNVNARRADELRGRHVVIVDDVLTTGSTAAEMSRTLLRAGVTRVDIWTIARSS